MLTGTRSEIVTDDGVLLAVNFDAHGLTVEIGDRHCVVIDTGGGQPRVYLDDAMRDEGDLELLADLNDRKGE